jgi:DNA polymerase III delta prime subunit
MKRRYVHWPFKWPPSLDIIYTPSLDKFVKVDEPLPHYIIGDKAFPAEYVEATLDAINDAGNALLYGPPGTGKTELAKALCRWLAPYDCGIYIEPSLIPRTYGVNLFNRVRENHSVVVLDDLNLLALPRGLTSQSTTLSIQDIQIQFFDFLESAREDGLIVIATTNLRPELLDWAIKSRLKAVHIPPPPAGWWDVLERYGYKVKRKGAGISYREALFDIEKPVKELEPKCVWRDRWEFNRIGAFRLFVRQLAVPFELYAPIAQLYACARKVVVAKNIDAVDYLGYYDKPIVVMPPVLDDLAANEIAHTYQATVLTPIASGSIHVSDDAVRSLCDIKISEMLTDRELFLCVRKYI